MKILFSFMLIAILSVTTWASLGSSVIDGFKELMQSRWGIATFFDTYFGFFTIYLWIAYKETSLFSRVLWFFMVMALGSIAFSIYILTELIQLPKGAAMDQLLLRRKKV